MTLDHKDRKLLLQLMAGSLEKRIPNGLHGTFSGRLGQGSVGIFRGSSGSINHWWTVMSICATLLSMIETPDESSAEPADFCPDPLTPEQLDALLQFEQSVFRQMDLELLTYPEMWPHFPFLPLQSPIGRGGLCYHGLMVFDESSNCAEHRTAVFDEVLVNMEGIGGNHTVEELISRTNFIVYETLAEIFQDGWQVP